MNVNKNKITAILKQHALILKEVSTALVMMGLRVLEHNVKVCIKVTCV